MPEISDEEYRELQELRRLNDQAAVVRRNPPFTQFYNDHLSQIQWLCEKNSMAAAIWFYLVRAMDDRNLIIVSQNVLKNEFDTSKSTVARSIKFLNENGFIVIHKVGTANAYSINHELVWKRGHNEKQYAFDTANVIFAEEEQKGMIDKLTALKRQQEIGLLMEEREKRVQASRSPMDIEKEKMIRQAIYTEKEKALREKKELGE